MFRAKPVMPLKMAAIRSLAASRAALARTGVQMMTLANNALITRRPTTVAARPILLAK